jgi:hypothetical protein
MTTKKTPEVYFNYTQADGEYRAKTFRGERAYQEFVEYLESNFGLLEEESKEEPTDEPKPTHDFRVGDIVRISMDVGNSNDVIGAIGKITADDHSDYKPLNVHLYDYEYDYWWCDPKALDLIYRDPEETE